MELADHFDDIAGEYARLLLLLDMAREKATMLGESEMASALHSAVHVTSARLMELTNEVMARRIISAE